MNPVITYLPCVRWLWPDGQRSWSHRTLDLRFVTKWRRGL